MGCGNSKPDIEGNAPLPAGFRWTIDDIKRRMKSTRSTSAISAEQLLDASEVGDEDEERDSQKRNSSFTETDVGKGEKVESNNNKVAELGDKEKGAKSGEMEKVEKCNEPNMKDKKEKDHDEEEDTEEKDGSELAPGSPSFREYCVTSTEGSVDGSVHSDDAKDHGKDENGQMAIQRTSEASSVSSTNSERSASSVLKKNEGRRSFKIKIIPKGTPVGVRKLLNVTACYVIPCSTAHPSPRLVPAPAPAPAPTPV